MIWRSRSCRSLPDRTDLLWSVCWMHLRNCYLHSSVYFWSAGSMNCIEIAYGLVGFGGGAVVQTEEVVETEVARFLNFGTASPASLFFTIFSLNPRYLAASPNRLAETIERMAKTAKRRQTRRRFLTAMAKAWVPTFFPTFLENCGNAMNIYPLIWQLS